MSAVHHHHKHIAHLILFCTHPLPFRMPTPQKSKTYLNLCNPNLSLLLEGLPTSLHHFDHMHLITVSSPLFWCAQTSSGLLNQPFPMSETCSCTCPSSYGFSLSHPYTSVIALKHVISKTPILFFKLVFSIHASHPYKTVSITFHSPKKKTHPEFWFHIYPCLSITNDFTYFGFFMVVHS